jgi:plasmid stabilization system protein ParE
MLIYKYRICQDKVEGNLEVIGRAEVRAQDGKVKSEIRKKRACDSKRLSTRRRDEDLRPGLRSFLAGEYVIIYRVEDEEVLILHVIRASRDIEALFRHRSG